MPKVEGGARIKWSLSGPFFLVGSWDAWKGMHPMQLDASSDHFCASVPLPRGTSQVEFQIIFEGDWARRFCPESKELHSAPVGPVDVHGLNWTVATPQGCRLLRVLWDPKGMRRLAVDFPT